MSSYGQLCNNQEFGSYGPDYGTQNNGNILSVAD